jgi:hypothetical protein
MEDMPLPCTFPLHFDAHFSHYGSTSDGSTAMESRSGFGGERRAFSSAAGMGNGYNGTSSSLMALQKA